MPLPAGTDWWSCPPAAASPCATNYQALALGGLTLVVSPLIALMKDQVDGLRANGVAAEFLDHTLDDQTAAEVERTTL